MDKGTARELLKEYMTDDKDLFFGGECEWKKGADTVMLDGHFTPSQLEAIAWWMRHHPGGVDG